MDPQLRRPLFVVGTVAALALSAWIALRHVGDDDSDAFVLGGTLGRFVITLVVVMGVRLVVRATSDRPDLVSFPAVTCAAAVLALLLTVAAVGGNAAERQRDFHAAVADTRDCADEFGDPLARVRAPYALRTLDPETQEIVDKEYPRELRKGVEFRALHRDSEPVGLVMAAAVSDDPQQKREFLEGVGDGAEEEGAKVRMARIAGRNVTVGQAPDVVMVAGPIDCGAVAVFADDERTARKVWAMLAAPA